MLISHVQALQVSLQVAVQACVHQEVVRDAPSPLAAALALARVVAAESEDLVNALKAKGKDLELLIFEDEGHDVLKYENRVACYNAITDFFAKYLNP